MTTKDPRKSHKQPLVGVLLPRTRREDELLEEQLEWDAEFINEKPGELIAWQSLSGADVQSAGSVHFSPISGGESTRVTVVLGRSWHTY